VEVSQLAEEVGFDAVCFPEHHLHSEGIEVGSLPVLTQHVIHNTKRIKVGPIGYVLLGWNPLRLALEIAWLDQLTKGRTFVGFARGYQTRWLNQMAQKIHVGATASDKSEGDRINREAFEEVFRFLKLAWEDEPFRFSCATSSLLLIRPPSRTIPISSMVSCRATAFILSGHCY
jgi:alkanesulfonate monooxygenase SsuD/methylene tetrahydromethanopterin reductase-like flavin-dependent oxidoreductase (luciferase family)